MVWFVRMKINHRDTEVTEKNLVSSLAQRLFLFGVEIEPGYSSSEGAVLVLAQGGLRGPRHAPLLRVLGCKQALGNRHKNQGRL
jgi:hypothetical protein